VGGDSRGIQTINGALSLGFVQFTDHSIKKREDWEKGGKKKETGGRIGGTNIRERGQGKERRGLG